MDLASLFAWPGTHARGTPFASLSPAPPTVSFVPASRELVSGGPLPLPVSGGGHAPGRVFQAMQQSKWCRSVNSWRRSRVVWRRLNVIRCRSVNIWCRPEKSCRVCANRLHVWPICGAGPQQKMRPAPAGRAAATLYAWGGK